MLEIVSMFGVKIYPHRFPLIFIVTVTVLLSLTFYWKQANQLNENFSYVDDVETINLADLFSQSFKLIHEAGHAIKSFKTQKTKSEEIMRKKSFAELESEPVTHADIISHSIITKGLVDHFKSLQIVSEEKKSISDDDLKSIKDHFDIKPVSLKLPSISKDDSTVTVPLSSVAVWVDPLDATQEFTENLLEYVTVMICVTVDKKPTIGMIYAPFTNKITWGWVGIDHSEIKRNENNLRNTHQPNVDEIVISRSHAGSAHSILKKVYHDRQYKIIPAAGSGYKTVHVIEEYADYYLHITPIKKWDLCAPDALLRSFGGTMRTLKNQPITYNHYDKNMLITDGLLATYKRNHDELFEYLIKSNLTKYMVEEKH